MSTHRTGEERHMYPSITKRTPLALGIAALLPLLASAATPADEARIERLEQQVQVLLKKLDAQERQLNRQEQQISEKTVVSRDAVIATTNGRSLTFKDGDGNFSFQVGGRLQADAAFYDADVNDFGDGTRVRRLFLDVRGT